MHESFAVKAPEHCVHFGLGGCRTRGGVEKPHLAKKVAAAKCREHDVDRAVDMLTDHHLTGFNQIERVGVVQLAEDDRAGGSFL